MLNFNYHNRDHELDIKVLPTPLKNKQVDIILPFFNDVSLLQYAVKSIKTFTTDDLYNLYILNNGSSSEDALKLLRDFIFYLGTQKKHNIGIVNHNTIGKEWNGSESHGIGLNSIIGSGLLTSKNIFLMHTDSAPLSNIWLTYMLSKIDEGNKCVGTYWNWKNEEGIEFLHCSGLLVDRKFAEGIDYRPNPPKWDTIGALTMKLHETKSKFFICKNSRNDTSLRKYHAYAHERGSEVFDESDPPTPMYVHVGRGSSTPHTDTRITTYIRNI